MFFNKKQQIEIEALTEELNKLKEENKLLIGSREMLENECSALKNENEDLTRRIYNYESSINGIESSNYSSISSELDGLLKELVGQDKWVIENINYINNIGLTVKSVAKSAEDTINSMTQTTKDTSSVISDFTKSFEELLNRVRSIEAVTSQINGIASQTQLLSLNASIESARAGEAGRGFTVVAEEIKKLSENTSALLKDIQNTVKETYDIAVKSKEQIVNLNHGKSDSLLVAKEAKQGFGDVVIKIEEITEKISEIKKAGDKHLSLSETIISKVSII